MTAKNLLQRILEGTGQDSRCASFCTDEYGIRQILSLLQLVGRDLSIRVEWSKMSKWVQIPGSKDEWKLPEDFHRMSERGTLHLLGEGFHPLRLVIAPEQWAFLCQRPSKQGYAHLAGGKLLFSPRLPEIGAQMRYVSCNWVRDSQGMEKSSVEANTDSFLIPEILLEKGAIWRWRRNHGLAHEELFEEFEATLLTEIRADRGKTAF